VIGPLPYAPQESFRLPDFEREAFLELPPEAHELTASNRTLAQSAAHRILYHGAWRQPMTRRNAATAVAITGGQEFNDRHELEGSVSLYFNNAGERVIFDSNLWLSYYSTENDSEQSWTLPELPSELAPANAIEAPIEAVEYAISRIIQLRQTREMRSDELHYIDHPAMGMLVQVTPYLVPEALPESVPETFTDGSTGALPPGPVSPGSLPGVSPQPDASLPAAPPVQSIQ
jgi:hypothetical protein